jgi:hypothetical protein
LGVKKSGVEKSGVGMSCNLLTAIGTLLPEFFWTFTFPKFYGGNVGCKLMKYFFMVGPYLSSYTLVMTAVDRYQVLHTYTVRDENRECTNYL